MPIAMQNTETITGEFVINIITQFVINIITQFQVPKMFLNDRGARFSSAMITDIQID